MTELPPALAPAAAVLVGRSRHLGDEAVRYLVVGVLSIIIEWGGFALLRGSLGWGTIAATLTGHAASIAVNYVLSAFWVFRWRRHPRILVELPCFLLIAAISMSINVGVMAGAEQFFAVTGMAAKIPASILVAVWAIAAKRLWLFARPPEKTETSLESACPPR